MTVFLSVDGRASAGSPGRLCDRPHYGPFRRLMTAEANLAVAGAVAGGFASVVVNDSHDGSRNLLYLESDPRAVLISGFNKPLRVAEGSRTPAVPCSRAIMRRRVLSMRRQTTRLPRDWSITGGSTAVWWKKPRFTRRWQGTSLCLWLWKRGQPVSGAGDGYDAWNTLRGGQNGQRCSAPKLSV